MLVSDTTHSPLTGTRAPWKIAKIKAQAGNIPHESRLPCATKQEGIQHGDKSVQKLA